MSGLLERIARRRRATASSRLGPPPGTASTLANGGRANGSATPARAPVATPPETIRWPPPKREPQPQPEPARPAEANGAAASAAPPPAVAPPQPGPGPEAPPEPDRESEAERALISHAERLATFEALAEIEALREPESEPALEAPPEIQPEAKPEPEPEQAPAALFDYEHEPGFDHAPSSGSPLSDSDWAWTQLAAAIPRDEPTGRIPTVDAREALHEPATKPKPDSEPAPAEPIAESVAEPVTETIRSPTPGPAPAPSVAPAPAPPLAPAPPPAPAPPLAPAPPPAPAPPAASAAPPASAPPAAELSLAGRSRVRRRVRYLRKLREVQLRDLGGFLLELHRYNRERPDLVRAKVEYAANTDRELKGLEMALDGTPSLRELREAGIGGACAHCGAVHGSADRFCSSCGERLGRAPRAQPDNPGT